MLHLTDEERAEVEQLVNRHKTPQQIALRGRIILLADEEKNDCQITRELRASRDMVRLWRQRWLDTADRGLSVWERLQDLPRPGRPLTFSAEQLCHLYAIACEDPAQSGRPINRWTPVELADELIKREIVESISSRHVGRLLDGADRNPMSSLMRRSKTSPLSTSMRPSWPNGASASSVPMKRLAFRHWSTSSQACR